MPRSHISSNRGFQRTRWPTRYPGPQPPDPNLPTSLFQPLPHIILNAISGLSTSNTFCLYDFLQQTRLTVLIDSGNTYNFIQPRVVKFLALPTREIASLRVMVGNESIFESRHQCAAIELLLQNHSFIVTLHVLPIGLTSCWALIGWSNWAP